MNMKPINKQALQAAANLMRSKQTPSASWQNTDTLPHQLNGSSIQLSIPDWINTKFLEAYGHKWNHTDLPHTWNQGISTLTTEKIRFGVSQCLLKGSGWPPSLPEFVTLCNGASFDIEAAYDRLTNREPVLSEAEQQCRNECSFACRRLDETRSRAMFKKCMTKWLERERDGTMPQEGVKMISQHPVDKLTDRMIDERMKSGVKSELQKRIDRIRSEK